MTRRARDPRAVVLAILGGSSLVLGPMAWSARHPAKPMVTVEGLAASLGEPSWGRFQRHSWSIHNDGATTVMLKTHYTSGRCGFSLWLGEPHTLPPGGSLVVWLDCPVPENPASPFTAYADVATDDPECPRLRFRVYGISRKAEDPSPAKSEAILKPH